MVRLQPCPGTEDAAMRPERLKSSRRPPAAAPAARFRFVEGLQGVKPEAPKG